MKTQTITNVVASALTLLVLSVGSVPRVHADEGDPRVEVALLGGIQALNRNDTALPDAFLNAPALAALSYTVNRNWAIEGEFSWMIPVKRSVDLGTGGNQDRKTPDMLTYQANLVVRMPLSNVRWTPYLSAGGGAVTFLSNTDTNRFPQLARTQTMPAANAGVGATYDLGSHWTVRGEFRELAAFPSKDSVGLSAGNKADPIWMERGAVGLAYGF